MRGPRCTEATASSGLPGSSRPGPCLTVEVDSAEALVALAGTLSPGEVELHITLDPTQPVEESALWPQPPDEGDGWCLPTETVETVRRRRHSCCAGRPGHHLAHGGPRPPCTIWPYRLGSAS